MGPPYLTIGKSETLQGIESHSWWQREKWGFVSVSWWGREIDGRQEKPERE